MRVLAVTLGRSRPRHNESDDAPPPPTAARQAPKEDSVSLLAPLEPQPGRDAGARRGVGRSANIKYCQDLPSASPTRRSVKEMDKGVLRSTELSNSPAVSPPSDSAKSAKVTRLPRETMCNHRSSKLVRNSSISRWRAKFRKNALSPEGSSGTDTEQLLDEVEDASRPSLEVIVGPEVMCAPAGWAGVVPPPRCLTPHRVQLGGALIPWVGSIQPQGSESPYYLPMGGGHAVASGPKGLPYQVNGGDASPPCYERPLPPAVGRAAASAEAGGTGSWPRSSRTHAVLDLRDVRANPSRPTARRDDCSASLVGELPGGTTTPSAGGDCSHFGTFPRRRPPQKARESPESAAQASRLCLEYHRKRAAAERSVIVCYSSYRTLARSRGLLSPSSSQCDVHFCPRVLSLVLKYLSQSRCFLIAGALRPHRKNARNVFLSSVSSFLIFHSSQRTFMEVLETRPRVDRRGEGLHGASLRRSGSDKCSPAKLIYIASLSEAASRSLLRRHVSLPVPGLAPARCPGRPVPPLERPGGKRPNDGCCPSPSASPQTRTQMATYTYVHALAPRLLLSLCTHARAHVQHGSGCLLWRDLVSKVRGAGAGLRGAHS
ncbi:hypothetical protein C7M84_022412 [Penaeus vannamei]|uniref:Uncharacterized protein n=1 Tax=Penaeus vannamei TaxID=6689 RepID=A0A423U6N5_PENVA|nr:hypothetical protein C7M84_022412 [Penaeus vannamei]